MRRKTRLEQASATINSLTEFVAKQLELLEKYRPALDRIGNEENWATDSTQQTTWVGESTPLTIAQEAIKLELPVKAKEEPDALHNPIP